MGYLLVAIGGGIGAALRHGVNRAALAWLGPAFPYGTLFANLTGAFFMGLIAQWLLGRAPEAEGWRLLLVTGLLGGFTTFSAFTWEIVAMGQRGAHGAMALYMAVSVLLSIALLLAGMAAARAFG